MVVSGLPEGILFLYVLEPAKKTGIETKMVIVDMAKPHSHPLLSSTQTTKVTAIRAPNDRQKTK